MARIADLSAAVSEVPLRHAFATAQDVLARQVTRPVILTITLDDERKFAGEAVPVAYVTGETPEAVLAAVERARPALLDADLANLRPITDALAKHLPDSPSARAGIEIAVWRAHAACAGVSLWQLFGSAKSSIETDITLPIADDFMERAHEAHMRGFRRFKVKVGSPDLGEDLQRIRSIVQRFPDGILRIDANQAFESAAAALEFLETALRISPMIEVFEQPTPKHDLAALDAVAARYPQLVFADEAAVSAQDVLHLLRTTCLRGINVKLMKSGVQGTLDIIDIARETGCRLMIGCMLETRRNIGFALQLACGTGAFAYADLDSHLLLQDDATDSFREDGPRLYADTAW